MSKIEIKGLVLKEVLPLIDQVLDLPDGVSILYGKNGVGKTQILRAASYAANPDGESPGSFALFFRYPWNETWRRRDGRQSPWFHNSLKSLSEMKNVHEIREDLNEFDEFDGVESRVGGKVKNLPPDDAARQMFSLNGMSEAETATKANLVSFCREVVEQGMFSVWFWGRGSHTRLSPVVCASDSTPVWHSIIHDFKSMSIAQLDDKYGTQFGGDVQSELDDDLKKKSYPWHGFELHEISTTKSFKPPIDFIDETSGDLSKLTVHYFVDLLKMSKLELNFNLEQSELETVSMLVENSGSFCIDPLITNAARNISARATEYFKKLLSDAPNLRCDVRDLSRWGLESPIEWVAEEKYREIQDAVSSEHDLPISKLSNAQQRWAAFAIKLSMINVRGERPLFIVIDEPEQGLHRRAERQLALGIAQITSKFNAKCLIATHSPVFLNDKTNNLIHVRRNESGNTTIGSLSSELSERIDEYGIDRSDLLQFCNTFVIVEGEHDRWVLDEMLKSEFDKVGTTVMALRGLKKLKLLALDSQFMFKFTTADVVIMFDNDKVKVAQDIWARACRSKDEKKDFIKILDELKLLAKNAKKKADEYSMINDFCVLAINEEARSRVKFHGLTKQDVIDYFSPTAFIKQDLKGKKFEDLRLEFDQTGESNFKDWLIMQYGARFEEGDFRNAVKQLDSIPSDFSDLLNIVRKWR